MTHRSSLFKRLLSPMIRSGQALARNQDGATAIEFGILALPFFTIVFAIIETTMTFFAGQVLESAVQDSSRLIRTGQAQSANYDATAYRAAICSGLYGLFDCTKLQIKVTKVTSFTTATASSPLDPCAPTDTTCNWKAAWESYTPGVGKDIIMVQAYYKWPLIVVLPWFNFKNQPDNYRLLGATRVFRNEPFGGTSS